MDTINKTTMPPAGVAVNPAGPPMPPLPPAAPVKTAEQIEKENKEEMEKVRKLDPVVENHPSEDGKPAVNPKPNPMMPPISNPGLAAGLNPEDADVELYREIHGVRNTIMVHSVMVGDYLRAGWSKE